VAWIVDDVTGADVGCGKGVAAVVRTAGAGTGVPKLGIGVDVRRVVGVGIGVKDAMGLDADGGVVGGVGAAAAVDVGSGVADEGGVGVGDPLVLKSRSAAP
jgi:hypothetical protein